MSKTNIYGLGDISRIWRAKSFREVSNDADREKGATNNSVITSIKRMVSVQLSRV